MDGTKCGWFQVRALFRNCTLVPLAHALIPRVTVIGSERITGKLAFRPPEGGKALHGIYPDARLVNGSAVLT